MLDPLTEKAVTRVNGVCAGIVGNAQHLVHVEVGLYRIEPGTDLVSLVGFEAVQGEAILVGVDGDGAYAELTRGTQHPDRDLAAVRNQQLAE